MYKGDLTFSKQAIDFLESTQLMSDISKIRISENLLLCTFMSGVGIQAELTKMPYAVTIKEGGGRVGVVE